MVAEDDIRFVVGDTRAVAFDDVVTGADDRAVLRELRGAGRRIVRARAHDVGYRARDRLDRAVAARQVRIRGRQRAVVDRVDGQRTGQDVHVDAAVTVDVVGAALTDDDVVAGAAGEVVARLRTDDPVVAHTAVSGDADGRYRDFQRHGRVAG